MYRQDCDSGGMCSRLVYLHKDCCRFESQEKNVRGKLMRISNVTQNLLMKPLKYDQVNSFDILQSLCGLVV